MGTKNRVLGEEDRSVGRLLPSSGRVKRIKIKNEDSNIEEETKTK